MAWEAVLLNRFIHNVGRHTTTPTSMINCMRVTINYYCGVLHVLKGMCYHVYNWLLKLLFSHKL